MTESNAILQDVQAKLDLILEGWTIMRKDLEGLKTDARHIRKDTNQLQIEMRAVREMVGTLQVDLALVKRVV